MCEKYKFLYCLQSLFLFTLLISGCSTKSMIFSPDELKLVPNTLYGKLLSSKDPDVTIEINAKSMDGTATVKTLDRDKGVMTIDQQGREITLPFHDVTRIERITHLKREGQSTDVADIIGYTVIYAPIAVVAAPLYPIFHWTGLDANRNAEDTEKAGLVYRGMSKEELTQFLGNPKEKYKCEATEKHSVKEIWVYDHAKVLRGGRSLFIDPADDKVYHNSYDASFFKSYCSLMTPPVD